MTRIVYRDAEGPAIVDKSEIKGEKIAICRCGLSMNSNGLCDGNHRVVKNEPEEVTVKYQLEDGKLVRKSGPCGCCSE